MAPALFFQREVHVPARGGSKLWEARPLPWWVSRGTGTGLFRWITLSTLHGGVASDVLDM